MLRVSKIPNLTRSWGRILKSTAASVETTQVGSNVQENNTVKIPFAKAKIGPFFQAQPEINNQFIEDVTLRSYLKRFMPPKVFQEISPDLERFGKRVTTDIYQLGLECEKNPPRIQHYDAWGKRVDEIITCDAWRKQKNIAAEEGLIAIAYERKYKQWSRLYQVAKLYLYAPSSGLFSCPLAMTDGAAKSLEVIGDRQLMDYAYTHLVSRNKDKFWTSGQWMTERKGGSDVANGTETLAIPQPDGSYRLHGYKWFTSATDSNMSLTLARVVNSDGSFIEGTKGLAMFYLDVRNPDGSLNGIEVQKLKDKLGTRQLPTAEMLLDGTRAFKVSADGRGVASISHMLTLTRIHNSTSAASGMRRMINLSKDYSTKRECFGQIIKDHPIHIKVLAHMEIEARSATLLTLELARFLGLDDCGMITDHEKNVFRLMTPVAKLYTAKQAVALASEGLESFGGAGYLEDANLAVGLRDAQVLPIWEGTTNILSLDVLRAMAKTNGEALRAFHKEVTDRVTVAKGHPKLADSALKVEAAANQVVGFASQNTDKLMVAARDFAYSLARTYMGMLLLEHACWKEASEHDILAANRWCEQNLVPMVSQLEQGNYDKSSCAAEYGLLFEGYTGRPSSKL